MYQLKFYQKGTSVLQNLVTILKTDLQMNPCFLSNILLDSQIWYSEPTASMLSKEKKKKNPGNVQKFLEFVQSTHVMPWEFNTNWGKHSSYSSVWKVGGKDYKQVKNYYVY